VSALAGDPRAALDQYEALRREATAAAPDGPRGQGLALFLARGMSHWLAALTALAPAGRPALDGAPPARGPTSLPAGRAELTAVLAGMVLACAQDEGVR
jgi:hypothetical protein